MYTVCVSEASVAAAILRIAERTGRDMFENSAAREVRRA